MRSQPEAALVAAGLPAKATTTASSASRPASEAGDFDRLARHAPGLERTGQRGRHLGPVGDDRA